MDGYGGDGIKRQLLDMVKNCLISLYYKPYLHTGGIHGPPVSFPSVERDDPHISAWQVNQ